MAARFTNEGFQLHDFILNLELEYFFKNFYLEPKLMFDYYFPKDYSTWNVIGSLTLGYNF